MAAGIKLTKTYPFPPLFLPLAILALVTIAAFIHAVHTNFSTLAALWTPCNGPPFLSQPDLPTPLCFAIHFFQNAHATLRGRLEQAIIVCFLAGLATITAVESGVEVQHQADHEACADEKKSNKENNLEEAQKYWDEKGSIGHKIMANLTISWLLYSLALGALAWQAIIVPAFLYRQHQKRNSQTQSQLHMQTDRTNADADVADTNAYSPAIPLSIALGLFLPATLMLLLPSAPLPIILFLLFPLWVTLIKSLLHPLTSFLITSQSKNINKELLFIPPIIASTIAHIIFLFFITTTSTSTITDPSIYSGDDASASASASTATLLLLEIDHAAIYLTTLYWIYIQFNTNIISVLVTLVATIAIGPGAAICVGWLYNNQNRHRTSTKGPTNKERRKSGKATGCFFEL